MGRAHIEFIQQQDISWEVAALGAGTAPVERKMLSRDDGTGAETVLMRLAAGWRTSGLRAAPDACELFVLHGRLQLSIGPAKVALARGGYLRIEASGLPVALEARRSTELLWLSAIGREIPAQGSTGATPFTFVDSEAVAWETPWVTGPEPGLRIKLLWRSEATGAYSRLIQAAPGWREQRLEHHDCIEEVYLIEGDMTMGALGTMGAGAYIWRPAGIKHGPMQTRRGGVMFIRTDGPLVNYYTDA